MRQSGSQPSGAPILQPLESPHPRRCPSASRVRRGVALRLTLLVWCVCRSSPHRFQMRIHKRIIDLHAPSDAVKHITTITIEPGVEVEIVIADTK
jgi:hypothetical protein